jgi:hypothetical protein
MTTTVDIFRKIGERFQASNALHCLPVVRLM